MLKGLPASGKSTYAKLLVDKGWVRVNKDDLRDMLNNGKWSRPNESVVIMVRDSIISHALTSGRNVVVDDTNLHPRHIMALREIAKAHQAGFEEKFFEIDLDTAIKRDLARPRSVGSRVIKNMYAEFIRPAIVPPVYDPTLPSAIIVDIDGTLAHMNGRGPYDSTKYMTDTVDATIRNIVYMYQEVGDKAIIVSGRSDDSRAITEEWLAKHSITYDALFMRPGPDDNRNDAIIKREIYEAEIAGKYNVRFVLDDRDRVVRQWRELGLKVLQCEDGDF